MKKIADKLFKYQDLNYRHFSSRSVPNIDKNNIIGVKVPLIRLIYKELNELEKNEFINSLPHKYLEENILHGIIISNNKNINETIDLLDKFLPYVDNWEVCDLIKPISFKKEPDVAYKYIKKCIKSTHTYKIRFSLVNLLTFYLDDNYNDDINKQIINIKNDDYYVKMAIAWYYSFALIKKYDLVINIFEDKKLDKWIHNKSIQKSIESYRVSKDKKEYLKNLKIK